jgi:hypothetical protein
MSDEPRVLREARLRPEHQSTGRTRHFKGAWELPTPSELRIVQYVGDPGFYLFYCDDAGREMTDTYHDTLEEALEQARWEFGLEPSDWAVVESGS